MTEDQSLEAILQQCDFELARAEIGQFFRMANEAAARQGGRSIYKTAFADGWTRFANTPNAETARAWIEAAPEYRDVICHYLAEACPGATTHSINKLIRDNSPDKM